MRPDSIYYRKQVLTAKSSFGKWCALCKNGKEFKGGAIITVAAVFAGFLRFGHKQILGIWRNIKGAKMEVELKAMLDDLLSLRQSLSDPCLHASIDKVQFFINLKELTSMVNSICVDETCFLDN